jgi:hypothetical protein
MTALAADQWAELAGAEIATAERPASAESFCRVAAAYEAADFPTAALAVLRKAGSFGVEGGLILPALLRALRRNREFAELDAAVQAGLAIADRKADLRRELALALACLNRAPLAETEWAWLVQAGAMSETDWTELARFVLNSPDTPLLVALMTAIRERPDLAGHPLASFCAVKHLIDLDREAAHRALLEIHLSRAGDVSPDLLLSLAILAWRLGEYAWAKQAAVLASSLDRDASLHQKVLGSIRSFAGDSSHLRTVALPRADEAGKRVAKLAFEAPRDKAGWGLLLRDGPDSLDQITDLPAEPDMQVPGDMDLVASFSVLPQNSSTDPFHILVGVDWSWPHLLLQRRPEGDLLHYFVEAPGHKDWFWEEVRPNADHAGAGSAGAPGPQPSAAWTAVMRELQAETEDEA